MCTTDIPTTIWHLTNNLERLSGRLCEFNPVELELLEQELEQVNQRVAQLAEIAGWRIRADVDAKSRAKETAHE